MMKLQDLAYREYSIDAVEKIGRCLKSCSWKSCGADQQHIFTDFYFFSGASLQDDAPSTLARVSIYLTLYQACFILFT